MVAAGVGDQDRRDAAERARAEGAGISGYLTFRDGDEYLAAAISAPTPNGRCATRPHVPPSARRTPSLARSRFWRDDVRWYGPRGVPDLAQPVIAFLLRGRSQGDDDLYIMINGGAEAVSFVIQDSIDDWHVAIDTSRPPPEDIELEHPHELRRPSYIVEGRSVVVLVRRGPRIET